MENMTIEFYSIWRMLDCSEQVLLQAAKILKSTSENQQEAAGSAIVYRAGCDGADGSFAGYISAGGSPEWKKHVSLRLANVILKQPIHRYMVQMILRLCRWGARVSRLCKIAALQYYAKNKGMLEEKNRGQVAKIIRELFEENCLLPVLQQFADLVPEVWEILDKTFVVYEGEPEKQLVLNYRRVEGELAEAQYHEMELPCVCDGIYAAGFILFPGERLQYYITVSERPEKILENGMLLAQEEAAEAMQGRYAWLYEMAQAQLLQEDLSAQKERTQNYLYTAFCAKRLFGMLK
ncbi:MAG: DUF5717 family protein [Gallintestinimicrobium sp.]